MVWAGRDLKDDAVPAHPARDRDATGSGCSVPIQPALRYLWERFEKKHNFPQTRICYISLKRGSHTSWIRLDVNRMSRSSEINFTLKRFHKFQHEAKPTGQTQPQSLSLPQGTEDCTLSYHILQEATCPGHTERDNCQSLLQIYPKWGIFLPDLKLIIQCKSRMQRQIQTNHPTALMVLHHATKISATSHLINPEFLFVSTATLTQDPKVLPATQRTQI